MKFTFNKKNIAIILFIVTLLFLAANIAANKIFNKKFPKTHVLSYIEIRSGFLEAAANLGIKDEWITELKKKKTEDTLVTRYHVEVPDDLPIPVVLNEISEVFKEDSIEFNSIENGPRGDTKLEIFAGDELKLYVKFSYNEDIKREEGEYAIILNDVEDVKTEDLAELIELPEKYALLLRPTKNSIDIIDTLLRGRKEYIILLDDDIEELKFKLAPDYDDQRLLNSVRSLIGAFPNSIFFMIDDQSEIYGTKAYSYISLQFENRNIKLMKSSSLVDLENSEAKPVDKFNSILKSRNTNDSLFTISAEQYSSLIPTIESYRKIGYKFLNPSVVVLGEN